MKEFVTLVLILPFFVLFGQNDSILAEKDLSVKNYRFGVGLDYHVKSGFNYEGINKGITIYPNVIVKLNNHQLFFGVVLGRKKQTYTLVSHYSIPQNNYKYSNFTVKGYTFGYRYYPQFFNKENNNTFYFEYNFELHQEEHTVDTRVRNQIVYNTFFIIDDYTQSTNTVIQNYFGIGFSTNFTKRIGLYGSFSVGSVYFFSSDYKYYRNSPNSNWYFSNYIDIFPPQHSIHSMLSVGVLYSFCKENK